jgi:hypothetical protein
MAIFMNGFVRSPALEAFCEAARVAAMMSAFAFIVLIIFGAFH